MLLKDEAHIANMCSFTDSLKLGELLEQEADVKFAMFPKAISSAPRISYSRRVDNVIGRNLHKVIRKNLDLEEDHDPTTGEYLE